MGPDDLLLEVRRHLERRRGGMPFGRFAKQVGIAPATLTELMNAPRAALAKKALGPKGLIGRAESVGRVYGFCSRDNGLPGVELDEVAVAFGLEPANVHVRRGLDRWKPLDSFLTHDDPTLLRIVGGDRKRPANRTFAGVLVWPPYCAPDTVPELSFAGKLMTRLLGSLHPLEWGPPKIVALDFPEILTPDVLKDGTVDAFFAGYDMPSRRLVGFDFIHVPGLSAPLGALSFVSPELTKEWTWIEILDPDRNKMRVFVVHADAGQLLVKGSCGYPEDRVKAIETDGAKNGDLIRKIARDLFDAANSFSSAMERYRRKQSKLLPTEFTFIADAAMVDLVHEEYEGLVQAARDRAPGMREAKVTDPSHCPTYRIGIAVSANSGRWRDILEDALINELFVNTGAITARSYAELLSSPSSIMIADLGPLIPKPIQTDFANDVIRELKTLRNGLPPGAPQTDHIGHVCKEIEKCWLGEPKTSRR